MDDERFDRLCDLTWRAVLTLGVLWPTALLLLVLLH